MDTTFRLPIFKQLVFRDILINKQSTLIFLGVLTGIILLIGWINHFDSKNLIQDTQFHTHWYGIFFTIIGIFQVATVYREFKRPATLQEYLLLPASSLEKWVSRWFRSLPFFIVTFTAAYWLATLLLNILLYVTLNDRFPFFNPFETPILDYWKIYVIIHSIFLIGAVHFNKNPVFKTLLTIFVLLTAYSIIGGGYQFLLFNPFKNEVFIDENSFGWLGTLIQDNINLLTTLLKILIWFVLVPFFWMVSYFKLIEKEV